jgi:tetratricopeptide (TPR) repeat protein
MTRRGNTIFRRLLAALGRRRRGPASPPAAASTIPREPDYDAAIGRALQAALRHVRHARRQNAQIRKLLHRFEKKDELDVLGNLPPEIRMYARFRALLERSWDLRFQDPARMVHLAYLAAACAKRVDPRVYGIRHVLDFQCEAQAALGNAYRVAQNLDAAEAALARARELFELGNRNLSLEAILLDAEASLDADRRRFKLATARLRKLYRCQRLLGDEHLAGRALIKLGAYTSYAGQPEKALAILRRSLDLIDADRDPTLAYTVWHNRVWILCDCGRFREAEVQLFRLRPLQKHQGGRITQLKLRWLEGRIDAGLGRLGRAEATLSEVRDGMTAVGRAYDAALAGLDLAAVLMGERKTPEAREVTLAAYRTFAALQIDREALVSLVILRQAVELHIATRAMIEEVATFLRKLETDPTLRFPGQAWEEEGRQ